MVTKVFCLKKCSRVHPCEQDKIYCLICLSLYNLHSAKLLILMYRHISSDHSFVCSKINSLWMGTLWISLKQLYIRRHIPCVFIVSPPWNTVKHRNDARLVNWILGCVDYLLCWSCWEYTQTQHQRSAVSHWWCGPPACWRWLPWCWEPRAHGQQGHCAGSRSGPHRAKVVQSSPLPEVHKHRINMQKVETYLPFQCKREAEKVEISLLW